MSILLWRGLHRFRVKKFVAEVISRIMNMGSIKSAGFTPWPPQTHERRTVEVIPADAGVVSVEQTERAAKRSEDYIAALRELKSHADNQRNQKGVQTYLDIAHFDGNTPLLSILA
jgi:hypothetical protein